MLNTATIAFLLGLLAGIVFGYLLRDLLRLSARVIRHIILRPALLHPSKPRRDEREVPEA